MRAITALDLPDVTPAVVPNVAPVVRIVDPATLFVDETYQRGLSDRSVKLIRKIVAEWSWNAFKPPVVVDIDGHLEVIDGQHTAIAAVTHGSIKLMPIMVVEAPKHEQRAKAFVQHNRDRIVVTGTQLHTALVAAKDETALTINQVCERAGVTIMPYVPTAGRFKPGETLAIATIRSLVNRRHAVGARRVLDICAKSGAAPISADLIKAVEHLLFSPEYRDEIKETQVALLVSAQLSTLAGEAGRFAIERKVPIWRALASIIFMNRRKARGG